MTGEPRNKNRCTAEKRRPGFTLIEVLVALAIAALGFGVVLHSVGLQMSVVANSMNRHQMLLYASQVLETNLANGLVEEEVTETELTSSNAKEEGEDASEAIERFTYALDTSPVTADPRIQQVSAQINSPNGSMLRLSAYRLRIKRD